MVISETEKGAMKPFNNMIKIARTGLRITYNKTKMLNALITPGTMLKVDKFKNLGEYITGRNRSSEGMKEMIKRLITAYFVTKEVYNKNKIAKYAKIKIYKAMMKNAVL